MVVTYVLKPGWRSAPDYEVGGVMRRDGAETIDVGERLRKGKGKIVTDDPAEIEALDGFEPLERKQTKED